MGLRDPRVRVVAGVGRGLLAGRWKQWCLEVVAVWMRRQRGPRGAQARRRGRGWH